MHHTVPYPHWEACSSNQQSESGYFERQLLIEHLLGWVEKNISKVQRQVCGADIRMCEGSVNGSAPDFHGGDGVQHPDSTLERLEVWVLVREHAKSALVDAKADARMNVLLSGLEPSITRGLSDGNRQCRQLGGAETRTCLKM